MVGAFAADHRMRDAAQLFEPDVALFEHFGDRMAGEDRGRQSFGGRFGGDGLGAVFAKLGHFAMAVGIGPRAARAIEAVFLIDFEQRLKAALDPHFLEAEVGRFVNGYKSRCRFMPVPFVGALVLERRFVPLDSVGQMGVRVGRPVFIVRFLRSIFFVLLVHHSPFPAASGRYYREGLLARRAMRSWPQ